MSWTVYAEDRLNELLTALERIAAALEKLAAAREPDTDTDDEAS